MNIHISLPAFWCTVGCLSGVVLTWGPAFLLVVALRQRQRRAHPLGKAYPHGKDDDA